MRKIHQQLLAIGLALVATMATAQAKPVVIGSTNFAEQLILANIYAEVLHDRGVDVKKRLNLGSREIVYPALTSGEIDVLPEYTGALLAHISEGDEIPARKEKAVIKALKKALPDSLVMLKPASAQDKDALVVTRETADKYDLENFSDLAKVSDKLVIGGPPEMETRRVGLPGLKDMYGMEFASFRPLDAGGPVTTGALQNGDIDVARMFTTQGVIDARGWVVLDDDKELSPAQNLVPIVRKDVLTGRIRSALNAVSAQLTTAELQRLNRQVGVDKRDPAAVARDWVKEKGLVGG